MAKDKMIVFAASQELKQRLVAFAENHDRTYGYVCRKALEEYLKGDTIGRTN